MLSTTGDVARLVAVAAVLLLSAGDVALGQVADPQGRASVVCATAPAMAFRNRPALGGDLSFIRTEKVAVPFIVGVTFMPFFIEVTDLPDGTVISADILPTPVLLTGAAVEVVAGLAVFDSFSLADPLPTNETSGGFTVSNITFSAVKGDGSGFVKLETGPLTPLNATDMDAPHYARLLHYGALRDQTPADVPDGVAMGEFYVGIFNQLGRLLDIDASVSAAIAPDRQGTLQPVGSVFRGRGAVKVTGLTFGTVDGVLNASAVLFTVRSDSGWVTTFQSPELNPRGAGASNDFFEFDQELSFIREDNAGTTAVLDVTFPPIVVRLLTSTRQFDSSNTGLVVRATASRGTIVGGTALVIRGVATFADLKFSGDVAPRAAVISFTVTPTEGRSLTLRSGDISVARTVIHAKHLVWAPWSSVTGTTPTRALIGTASGTAQLPPVSVRMLDSAFGVDPEAGPIPLEITADPPGLLDPVSGNATTIRRGSATFIAPTFTLAAGATAPVTVRFRVRDVTPGLENARSELSTADIVLDFESRVSSRSSTLILGMLPSCASATPRSARCELTIQFDAAETTKRTVLYAEDGPMYATVGSPIGTVRVRLHDQAGPLTDVLPSFASAAPQLVAHTGDDPLQETVLETSNGANRVTLAHDGTYTFTCLRFRSSPAQLVRLRFTAVDTNVGVLAALSLRSGFVRIVTVPTSDFAMRIASTATAGVLNPAPPITRPLQRSTAVLGVTLPPIAIEVVDSLGVLDSGRDTIPVTIVANTPDAAAVLLAPDGTSAVVQNGVALFDRLRFQAAADDVRIAFTATTTTGETVVSPVVGSSLSTGAFTITERPQPLSHVELGTMTVASNSGGASPLVVSEYGTEVVFGNLTDVAVTTVVKFRDSAHRPVTRRSHQRATSVHYGILDGIKIRSYSSEFDIDVTTGAYDASCACFPVTLRPRAWRSPSATGRPAYIHHEVVAVGASVSPALLGQRVTIGPITVTTATRLNDGSSCSGGTSSATAVAEFRMSLQAFDADLTIGQLAHVMAVERDRITVDAAAATAIERQEQDTLEAWEGVKVPVMFADPRPGDRNRQPSATLAAALINLNGDCVAPNLRLKTSYYPAADQSCEPEEFTVQAAAARQCMVTGQTTPCACYASLLMGDAGPRCVREKEAELRQICLEISQCQDAQIIAVCDRIPPESRNLTGLYVSSAALAVALACGSLFYLRKKRQRDAEKRTLAGG